MSDAPIRLRSPFTGEAFLVSPEHGPAFIEELIKRGFERLDDTPPVKTPRLPTKETRAHG